jgi:hypothetical protein
MGSAGRLVLVILSVLGGGVLVAPIAASAVHVTEEPLEFVDAIDPDEPLDAGTPVWAVLDGGDRLWIGGRFEHVGGVRQRNIAALDPTTGALDQSWNPDVTGRVEALALSPDGAWLYIGGRFATVDGHTIGRLARISTVTGEVDPVFAPQPDAVVRAIATDGNGVWIAGSFTTVNGAPQAHLAKVDATTGLLDATWRPSVDAKAFDVELHPAGLYVAGSFTDIDGVTVGRVARMDPHTAAVDTTWLPDAVHKVYDLSLHPDGSLIYLAGAGPLSRQGNSLRAFDTTSGELRWRRVNAGDWQAVVATDDLVYGGSHGSYVFADNDGPFLESPDNPNAIERHKVAAFDPLTGELAAWAPHVNSLVGVWALDVGSNGLLVGGDFTRINFKPRPHLAVFPVTDVPPPPPPPPPPEPEAQTCTATVSAEGVVTLEWTSIPGENRYIVRRNDRWLATPGDALTHVHDAGPGTHAYAVRSDQGANRVTTPCNPTITIDAPPPAIQVCSRSVGADGSVLLSWTPIDGEDRYIVRRNGSWLATTSLLSFDAGVVGAGDSFVVRSSKAGVTTTTSCD